MGRPKLDRKQIQSRVDAEVYERLELSGNVSKEVERIITTFHKLEDMKVVMNYTAKKA